jgi:hypothetical protein
MDTTATRRPGTETAEAERPFAEELLVADDRAGLSPSEMVERKLVGLLKTTPLPASQISSGRHMLRAR